MLRLLPLAAVGGILQATSVLAQATCSLAQKCPEDLPCCSQYGQCGVGAFCLGGCDPRMSFSLDSCVPAPVCQSKKYAMNSMDGIVDIGQYLGDPSKADWVASGYPAPHNGNVLLTMPPRSAGTVLASTVYMWYGTVKARLKTSVGAGVITAFILLSDVKDEIDFEFVGVDLGTAQTNYYFQGIPDYANSGNISGVSNTYDNFHEYEIRWTPDEIKWFVDGKEGRTKKRSETWNSTTNQWHFPQTPARVQLSIWPGGAPSNLQGTIDWAGGPIDWDSEYIKRNKYYFATFGEIEISCYNADSPPGTNKKRSYIFNDARGTNDTVEDTDRPTVLKSFSGTGRDMEAGFDPNDAQNSVPGGSSAGPGQNPGGEGGIGGNDCTAKDFSQNCGQNNNNNGAGPMLRQNMLGASSLAVVIAVSALLWL